MPHHTWERDARNPVLPPLTGPTTESHCAMNPYAVRVGDRYRLYYAGADADGQRRIHVASCPIEGLTQWQRHGVALDLGKPGAFDEYWLVVPLVYRIGERWHLYYSGRNREKKGLQSFTGIGLATSDDGIHFTRHREAPIITGDQIAKFPNNRGIAGGGNLLEERLADGTIRYRLYYTLATGTPNKDTRVDQEKHCCVCHSDDGITWTDHRLIMSPRPEVASEDYAVAAPFVYRDGDLYRMLYCGIGSRWGFYSISEAVSHDGYAWDRPEDNLSLRPGAEGSWEAQMVEYPCVLREGDHWRLFYCGNGYGATGIGTAVAPMA